MPEIHGEGLSPLARLIRHAMLAWYDRNGWTVDGTLPGEPKFVLAGAQHTSNWDFCVFVGAAAQFGRFLHFMGKDTLFRWPLKGLMNGLGGVPVDRKSRRNLVQQMADAFVARDEFVLVIAPEGTRAPTDEWKSGFYQIAVEANVPIVCAAPDYPSRSVRIGPTIWPTGDFEADMTEALTFFRGATPKYPDRGFVPPASRKP